MDDRGRGPVKAVVDAGDPVREGGAYDIAVGGEVGQDLVVLCAALVESGEHRRIVGYQPEDLGVLRRTGGVGGVLVGDDGVLRYGEAGQDDEQEGDEGVDATLGVPDGELLEPSD